MPFASRQLPLGLGGGSAAARAASLPPAFTGGARGPLGLEARADRGRADGRRSPCGEKIRGRARLGVGSKRVSQWWTAVCSPDAHPMNMDWPRTISLSVGGATFELTMNAVKHMAERMPARRRRRERSSDLLWKWGASSGGAGVDFPLSSLAGSLEKLAARLPSKAKKHHEGLRVDDWELGVTTESTPWRVTHAVYKPGEGDDDDTDADTPRGGGIHAG